MDDSESIKLLKSTSAEKELQIEGLQTLLQEKEQEITALKEKNAALAATAAEVDGALADETEVQNLINALMTARTATNRDATVNANLKAELRALTSCVQKLYDMAKKNRKVIAFIKQNYTA